MPKGMLAVLTAYRFLVGVGIGRERPARLVKCSQATGELKAGTRNRWFVVFTNVMLEAMVRIFQTASLFRASLRPELRLGCVLPPKHWPG